METYYWLLAFFKGVSIVRLKYYCRLGKIIVERTVFRPVDGSLHEVAVATVYDCISGRYDSKILILRMGEKQGILLYCIIVRLKYYCRLGKIIVEGTVFKPVDGT